LEKAIPIKFCLLDFRFLPRYMWALHYPGMLGSLDW